MIEPQLLLACIFFKTEFRDSGSPKLAAGILSYFSFATITLLFFCCVFHCVLPIIMEDRI